MQRAASRSKDDIYLALCEAHRSQHDQHFCIGGVLCGLGRLTAVGIVHCLDGIVEIGIFHVSEDPVHSHLGSPILHKGPQITGDRFFTFQIGDQGDQGGVDIDLGSLFPKFGGLINHLRKAGTRIS